MIINNLNDLEIFAEQIANDIEEYKFLGLVGELGSGKTQFTKFLVKALGGDIEEVVSPTFTILNEYFTRNYKVFHFDLYRLNSVEELEEIGYKEYFFSNEIIVVEWIDNIKEVIPEFAKILKFEIIDDNIRNIIIMNNE